ncbi:MAG: phosphate ABC transporter permease subunit PstC [Clostridiales bacterium]|nr:phosphate ABC transporter permease subunit PstC [Clostridiales bacterium]
MTIKGSAKSKSVLETVMQLIFLCCGLAAVLAVIAISVYMVIAGGPAITKVGIGKFLFGVVWQPTAQDPQFGILPMILSSIVGTFGAILLGVPIGLLTAVFMSQVAPKGLVKIVRPAVELLAGIPSVVYGLIGMMIIVPTIGKIFNLASGATMLSAIIVLAIMILPTIVSVSETALDSVREELREASLALGATPIQTIFKVIIPAARSGIVTGIILGVGRAIGETMAIIMVCGNVANMPNLFKSVRFLTTGIASEMSYAGGLHREVLFSIGLVLFIFIMVINIVINRMFKKQKQDE